MLPAFETASLQRYTRELTQEGKPRQRRVGGGAKGVLPSFAATLLFMLVDEKPKPLHTMHALQLAMSQPQAHYWIPH